MERIPIRISCLLFAGMLHLAACSPGTVGTTSPVTETAATSTSGEITKIAAPPQLPDLTGDLTWFAPLPPMPTDAGRPFTGSDDFMDLFSPDAPWGEAASGLQVFKLYGEWVAYHATPDQLRTAVEAIRNRGLALAVEAGPLDPPPECGNGIEGYAGTDEGALIANRILDAGGQIGRAHV